MCETEAILNNRPLTEASGYASDCEALTPNHLLLLSAGVTFPPGLFNRDDCYAKRRWKQVQYLSDIFWRRWRSEYLSLLQERQKWCKSRRSHSAGDLVLVIDIKLPRNQWPLGPIVDVFKDDLGFVRSASIRISKCKNSSLKQFDTSVIVRPITKLILLSAET